MRLLVAPDSFSGTLGAGQAAEAIGAGWTRQAPADTVQICPLSDGGPGFVDVLHAAVGGELAAVTVTGPLGRPVPATLLLAHSSTAYVESSQACGLHLVPPHQRDPGRTSTAGVGELVRHARALGAERIVLGLGGESTNDGGAGLLAALAGREAVRMRAGAHGLAGITAAELGWLPDLRAQWSGVDLVGAYDVDCPLLGFHGTSATRSPDKGAGPEQTQQLERDLADLVEAAGRALGEAARPGGPAAEPGAGSGGGLGYAIRLLDGRLVPGARLVLDEVGFDALLEASDLVVTGEGTFDWQSLRAGPVAEVAAAALGRAVPVVVLAGQVLVGRREAKAIGVDAAYPVARDGGELAAALADPFGTLQRRAAAVARTWSLPG